MLSDRPVEAPASLMDLASGAGRAPTVVIGADTGTALASVRAAAEAGLIEPILVGNPALIRAGSEALGWDIGGLKLAEAHGDAQIADIAARLVADPAIRIAMKGHVHTDAMMAALLRKETGLRIGRRLSHIFHMSVPGGARPLLITDAALNVAPDARTRQAITENLVGLCRALEMERPRIAMLSATEEKLAQMPSSLDAAELAEWARAQNWAAEFAGPLAFDNAVSPAAAAIKGLHDHPVAGRADALIVPTIEVGNALFKMMVHFMGACAAGVVVGGRIPIVLTSRADPPAARLASTALAAIAARA